MACVVVNPSKRDVTAQTRNLLADELRAAGYADPVWLETSLTETGAAQARLALASGASLVVAMGGDGTVRSVAAGLAGAAVEMAILPLGTANLAARNLGLPVGRPAEAARIAARGTADRVDLAWVSTEPGEPALPPPGGWARPSLGDEHACLVVAGLGFDADLIASTSPALKALIKWGAYAVAAFQNLDSPRMELVLSTGVEQEAVQVERMRARSLLIANGGRLPAGVKLLPEAVMDDGVLDVAAIDTVAGVVGWSSLARQVLLPYPSTYASADAETDRLLRPTGRVVLRRGTTVAVSLAQPAPVQVDGDLVAPTRGVRVRLQGGALRVRRHT